MRLTVSNNIRRLSSRQYGLLREVAYRSKNMYNAALYNIRQDYINNKGVLKYESNYHLCKGSDAYKSMNSATAQETMKLASEAMSSYLELRKLHVRGDLHFRPCLPNYLGKHDFQVIRHTQRAFVVKDNQVVLSIPGNLKAMYPDHQDLMSFEIPSQLLSVKDTIKQVHIVPCYDGRYFKISFVYEPKQQMAELDLAKYLSIDLGVNNFATCIDSNGTAVIIDGKYAKSLNQYYNKENARLQSIKDKQKIKPITTRQSRLIRKRENRMREFLNVTTKRLVDHCLENGIGNIVIGELKDMKQHINLGRKTNQKIVQMPFKKFKDKLQAKCQLAGIKFTEIDEAYTSQVDALAFDHIQKPWYGKKRRVKRGLYKSITGVLLNADINGALNIMRKVVSDSHVKGIIDSGLVNRPGRIRLGFLDPRGSRANFSQIKLV